MGPYFKCDVCQMECTITPKTEQLFEEIFETITTVKNVGGKAKKIKAKKKVLKPQMTKIKTQNFNTGEVEEKLVPKTKDLSPRCYQVSLRFGPQTIQLDLCEEHANKFLPDVNLLWGKMEGVKK